MKTLIIDGNNLIHRTFWVAKNQSKRNPDTTAEETASLHIYFTLNAIFSYVNKYKPTKTIVVWDEKLDYKPNSNSRKLEYEGYKGNRSCDGSPHANNEDIKRLLSNLGIPSIFPRDLEADDIVAYICKTFDGNKVIISVDQDFLQLVNNSTMMFDPIRKKEFVINKFEEMTGHTHENWLVVKCLQGDKSDNVPGIPGFGKVRVKKYLAGENELTQEQQAIYDMNFSLFSLDKIDGLADESKYYQDQLNVQVSSDWKQFIDECIQRKFDRILNKRETWYTLFFQGNKLESILG